LRGGLHSAAHLQFWSLFVRSFYRFLPAALAVAALTTPFLSTTAQAQTDHWVGTWAASPMAYKNTTGTLGGESGVTLREIVHVSLGGGAVRVQLSNEFGAEALTVTAAEIALHDKDSSVVAASEVPLTFGGRTSVVIPAGAMVVSDAAALKVKPLSDLAVSLFLPAQPETLVSRHGFADQTNYMVDGNAVAATELTEPKRFTSWDFLKGVDVKADADAASIVAFGDSITDGAKSTPNTNARWPDVLAARLLANKPTAKIGVLNQGIGGNRVLHDNTGPNALARFDRDVIAQTGVKYVILMESINDIGHAADPNIARRYDIVTADDLIAGLTQLARRAHTHGIKAIGATLTPYIGAGYQSPEGETMRQAVNAWIRTSKELDGVVDFDKATDDPDHPGVFLPEYDSGDHLHPKDAGYKVMGDAVDLKLFAK
jgi:lysophospholipase L1-like esterase